MNWVADCICLRRQGFDRHPTTTTELGGQLLRGQAPQELLLSGLTPSLGPDRRHRIGLGALQPSDVVVGLIVGESAAGLTLGESHRTAPIPEVAVSGALEQSKQLLKLP